ncbi:MAG: hypothetical protein HY681_13455 [Chloroflexi bacterium]|nr:hypothetical protein [Chloroflexota bacterium]
MQTVAMGWIEPIRSPDIRVTAISFGPIATDRVVRAVYAIWLPEGYQVDRWRLTGGGLATEVHETSDTVTAITWLEGVEEYGIGPQKDKAIRDLIISLGEYRESLEEREEQLGPTALSHLALLRRLIQRDRA